MSGNKINLIDILVENSTYLNTHRLKSRLILEGLLIDKCYNCMINNFWNGKTLSLQLDHINGINNDNRIENLRILCPNCHSQTDTYAGRNAKHIKVSSIIKEYFCSSCNTKITKTSNSGMCRSCINKKVAKRIVERPSIEILLNEIDELGYVGTGKKYGVSDNAIRKWIK